MGCSAAMNRIHFKDRNGVEREQNLKKKKRRKKIDFSPFYSHEYCSRAFHLSCHISFPAVHICVCVNVVSVRCVHVWTMWGSCSTRVIYSGGLWPYLFSISLMLGSGLLPAFPWPTGRRVWVGPPPKLPGISTTNTHTLSLTLSFPQLLSLASPLLSPLFKLTNTLRHTYSLSLSLLLCPALTDCSYLSWSCLPSADTNSKHLVTCIHVNSLTHTHPLADNHTHSHGLHSLPLPSPHQPSILCSQLMSCWLAPFILYDTSRMRRPASFTCVN